MTYSHATASSGQVFSHAHTAPATSAGAATPACTGRRPVKLTAVQVAGT